MKEYYPLDVIELTKKESERLVAFQFIKPLKATKVAKESKLGAIEIK